MDPENKEDSSKDFGKVIDVLHNKQKLSSLRTYQGDMAEFIKSKDESVISIAVKEKERKEKKEEQAEKLEPLSKPKKINGQGLQINFTIILLSLLLIGGGVLASFFIFGLINKEFQSEVVLKEEIIPYNNLITLANVVDVNFASELGKLAPSNGINIIKISDINGAPVEKAKDFFNFLNISPPSALLRTLKDQYVIGIISQDEKHSAFVVITINDFGGAFSAMLEWEENMLKDLAFLNADINTATASTTIPMKSEVFNWKDIIIKNKDARALANEKGKSQVVYTFLDKNTILITSDLEALGEISSAYASRSFTR